MGTNRLDEIGPPAVPDAVTDPRVVSVAAVLVGWQVASSFFAPTIFPGLGRMARNLSVVFAGTGRFQPANQFPITLARIVAGFAVAMGLGTLIGLAMGTRRRVERHLITTTLILLAVPAVVWAFVFVSWFGLTSFLVPVTTIVLVVVPYVTINVWEGTKDVDRRLVEMAAAFDAGGSQLWRDVYLPHLGPYLFPTVRIAFAISWKIALIAEMFGTTRGVGFAINYYFTRDAAGMVMAWALPVMLLVYLLDRALKRVEDRVFDWRENDGIDVTRAIGE